MTGSFENEPMKVMVRNGVDREGLVGMAKDVEKRRVKPAVAVVMMVEM